MVLSNSESVDEILNYEDLNESDGVVLFFDAVYFAAKGGSNF